MNYRLYILIFLLSPLIGWAQTYKEAFDELDNSINGGEGYTIGTYLNANNQLTWRESYILRAYLAMYRATKNETCIQCGTYYLDKFVVQAERVMCDRDDFANRH